MKKKILGTIKLISAIALCSPAPISFMSGVTCIAVAQNNMYNLYDNFIKAEANLDTDSQKYSSINKIKEPKKDDKEIVKEDKHKTIDLFDMSVYKNSIYYNSKVAKNVEYNQNLKLVGEIMLSLGTTLGASITGILVSDTKKEYHNKNGTIVYGNIIQANYNEALYQLNEKS